MIRESRLQTYSCGYWEVHLWQVLPFLVTAATPMYSEPRMEERHPVYNTCRYYESTIQIHAHSGDCNMYEHVIHVRNSLIALHFEHSVLT
jgi:hypothetical protein